MTRFQCNLGLVAIVFISLSGCEGADGETPNSTPDEAIETVPFEYETVLDLPACDKESVAAYPDHRCHTYRAVAGASMGGGTAGRIGFRYPELFDVVGIMGTPFGDSEFFWDMIETHHMGGFCELADLEEIMATHGPDALNDPDQPGVFCGIHDVFPLENDDQVYKEFPAVEGTDCWMFRSDYNHWYRGPDAGRGGNFSRNHMIEIFHDVIAAFGNPLYYNETSDYFPPDIPESWYVPPKSGTDTENFCDAPIVLNGVYNREYNPEGTYPAITYCEGASGDSDPSGKTGDYTPGDSEQFKNVIEFALAVDLNGNGIRDYGEPVIKNNRERYIDSGIDGVLSKDEPGYDPDTNPDPAGDDWDPILNYNGTEGNLSYDEGEAYDDDGLDGVPATQDYGEDNGIYDVSPTLERIFSLSPRRLWSQIDAAQLNRIDVWMDAGIRDFINTAQVSNALFGAIQDRQPDSKIYNDFPMLPGLPEDESYIYFNADYSREAMGQNAYLRYGDTSVCPSTDDYLGDGNHVGPDIIHRMYTLISFVSARMPYEGRNKSIGGNVSDLESPNGNLSDFGFLTSFESDVLSQEVKYGVLLPPDYYYNTEQEYPVLYFFHGQGQSAEDMVGIGLVLFGGMKESARADRINEGLTDFQRFIVIWADGDCQDDQCWTGNFYTDFQGLPRDDRRFESTFFELVDHVEKTYRAKKPHMVPLEEASK